MAGGLYRIVSFDRLIAHGVTESWQISISAVAKFNEPDVAPYCIPNELICAEIGRFLRLPVPPAGVVYAPQHAAPYWFASLDFNLAGDSLPPVDPDECVAELPDLSTGVLLFDILIANSDRHPGNLSLDLSARPSRMNVFDHSHALFGSVEGDALERLTDLRDRLGISGGSHTRGNRHCLLDVLPTDEHMTKWLDRIGSLPDFFIEDLCRESVGLGIGEAEADSAVDFLKYRRENLRSIIDSHRSEFQAIAQWGLFR